MQEGRGSRSGWSGWPPRETHSEVSSGTQQSVRCPCPAVTKAELEPSYEAWGRGCQRWVGPGAARSQPR